ncbi:hypothetical protein ACFY05_32105 [Microtetraspora fusca]|uniref:Uncharacterized protein n=1 Tax=Microtetraspora fusca TaxID=1997 RepID=A0ABW6VEG8_MICFU
MRARAWGRGAGRRLWRRVGRRGVSLLFVGALGLLISASLAFAPPYVQAQPGYQVLVDILPVQVWVTAWTAAGVLSLVQAFAKSDRLAYALTSGLMIAYGIAHVVGVFTGANPRGWVAASIWAAFGGWIALIATWPEAGDGDHS